MAIISKREAAPAPAMPDLVTTKDTSRYVWAVARIALGWIFLWAFIDKLFGFGFATPADKGWIDGGSPTMGFLSNAPTGPFEDFYKSIAGDAWADWLFMIGLAGIGLALLFGVGMRIAAATGALLMVLMYAAVLPPENNPVVDDHIIYAIVLIGLAVANAGDTFGFGRWWSRQKLVQRAPVLR